MHTTTESITSLLSDLDHRFLWHPFTPMKQWRESQPIIIERAEGFTLTDTDGRSYIDGYSSLWCNVHGHCVPEIDAAIRAQLDKVAHATMLGSSTVPAIELATELVRVVNAVDPTSSTSELNKVFYSDSGATATEVAFKMAAGCHFHRGVPERNVFISLSGGYHGDTVGAMSVGYLDVMHKPFKPLTFARVSTPAPDPRPGAGLVPDSVGNHDLWPSRDPARRNFARDAALKALGQLLGEVGESTAAFVIEPMMQGAGGMVEQPDGFVSQAVDLCRSHGVLVIADEVATGLARTGAMFACDLERVRPDIMCIAKGLSGGYFPLAATLCTENIARAFEGDLTEKKTLYHGHTYTGNPLGCAAAIASLELIEKNNVVENAARLGEIIQNRLTESLADHPHVGDVRNRGVMTGIELVQRRHPNWHSFDPALRIGARVCQEARNSGLMIRPLGDCVVLNPAPGMDEPTLHRLLDIVIDVIGGFDYC